MNVASPRQFWVMLGSVSIAAGGVLGLILFRAQSTQLSWALVFLGLAVLTESLPARLHNDVGVALTVVVTFVAIPFAGMPGAVAAACGAGVAAGVGARGSRVVKGIFNVGMFILATAAATTVYYAIIRIGAGGGVTPFAPDPEGALAHPQWLTLGMLLAGLAYLCLNVALMAVTVHLSAGLPLGPTVRQLANEIFVLQFLYVGLAAVAFTLLVQVGWISLVLLVVPLAVARQSLLTVQEQQEAFDRMVRTFVKAIELKDGYTRGHAERVSDLSVMVAESMGLSYDERQLIRYGAILHDVGKIGVSLGILCKAGPLTDDEFGEMKQHPEIGAEMLADIDFLQPALAIVHHHHERMDGRGYPAGLEGESIPLLTRVVTAVDAFDAMTSTRSYRRALPVSVALEELQANAGSQFDSVVVEHLVAVIDAEGWEITDEPVAIAPVVQEASS